jgi:HEAT repeat protein
MPKLSWKFIPGLTVLVAAACLTGSARAESYVTAGFGVDPYQYQINRSVSMLGASLPATRTAGLEALTALRAWDAADKVQLLLKDPVPAVRGAAAMNLGITGSRRHLLPLVDTLADNDWTVSQAAWISLCNLTGQDFPLDIKTEESRAASVATWRKWIDSLNPAQLPVDALSGTQAKSPVDTDFNWLPLEKQARTLGMLGEPASAVPVLVAALTPYLDPKHAVKLTEQKMFVEVAIRSLGRLGTAPAIKTLGQLLEIPQWSYYAAEALGDAGGEDAAASLIKAFPEYSIALKRFADGRGYDDVIQKLATGDMSIYPCNDRIPRAVYALAMALCRIDFSSAANRAGLKSIVPQIIVNIPADYDSTVIYEVEPYQTMSAWLLEKAGLRRAAVDATFQALGENRKVDPSVSCGETLVKLAAHNLNKKSTSAPVYAGNILAALCRDKEDVPLLINLLNHSNGWIRINAAKSLMFLEAKEAVAPLRAALEKGSDDASFGFCGAWLYSAKNNPFGNPQGQDEFNDPCPRWKIAFIRALGRFSDRESVPLLVKLLESDKNTLEVQHAAAQALEDISDTAALAALRKAEHSHPYHSVRVVAREALWRKGIDPEEREMNEKIAPVSPQVVPEGDPEALVFIKGPQKIGNAYQIPSNLQAYTTTDSGPTYRMGWNIFRLKPAAPDGKLEQVTHFASGWVADLEVSYDGTKILFCRRGGLDDPWWHLFEINADGSGLRQLTFGPYHDVQPEYLPDGRVIFSSSRIGTRDEYHGYLATGLTVMNADGSDIHCISFNVGRDVEPSIGLDGRILFSRLEVFYSRMKTEWNLCGSFPDGTKVNMLYGPERRDFWQKKIFGAEGLVAPRHRVLRIAQPQPWVDSKTLINSFAGPMLVGPGRNVEEILQQDNSMAITTPYPLSPTKLLVAAGPRPLTLDKNKKKVPDINSAVDHGLYYMDVKSGKLTLIYNDPATSEFEARPLQPRRVPPMPVEAPQTRAGGFTGRVLCASVFASREPLVVKRARYIRIVEGEPAVARHQTHTNGGVAWKNHGGSTGRILGIIPLAADGSFSAEIPADRFVQFQALDSDRRVVGNELIWQYVRPGENKSCVGCHEKADNIGTTLRTFPYAAKQTPVSCLPVDGQPRYRAKMWAKGVVRDEDEERMRTVNSINLLGRE